MSALFFFLSFIGCVGEWLWSIAARRIRFLIGCWMLGVGCSMFCLSAARAADLPDARLTPGVINPTITDPCQIKWGKDVRHVTLAMKKRVFGSYGIPWSEHAQYEVDHLISRELGGADDVRNLWPQHWAGPFGAHDKDRLENKLHALVCAGKLTLAEAQRRIATDWVAAFREFCTP